MRTTFEEPSAIKVFLIIFISGFLTGFIKVDCREDSIARSSSCGLSAYSLSVFNLWDSSVPSGIKEFCVLPVFGSNGSYSSPGSVITYAGKSSAWVFGLREFRGILNRLLSFREVIQRGYCYYYSGCWTFVFVRKGKSKQIVIFRVCVVHIKLFKYSISSR